uniref:CSON006295 protein n=1 Tax=Culicoides sonorensis TaxID=179676 RepID=A0A336MT00_CULSO
MSLIESNLSFAFVKIPVTKETTTMMTIVVFVVEHHPGTQVQYLNNVQLIIIFSIEKPKDSDLNEMIDGVNDGNESNDYDEEEEDDHSNYTETDFKFDDFVRRLVNPKVVRACTTVLIDWRQIPTRSLKSAVAILHHIAVRCKMPVMLFQARLFRVFQGVLHAKMDKHNEELHRLATFIVKQFVQIAPNNPKIFAELLFFKSIRESEMISNGYEDVYNDHHGGGGNKKASWTEQEEEELRRLFMENQANPETDEDVIDWLARNLIDQAKTRRQIIMKLKQLGLIFKAPTKKSNANAANKRLWRPEQDEQLRELYDKYRLEENTLNRIMDTFSLFKSKNAVIKRMLELGLIADRSEIVKTRKRDKNSKNQDSDDSDANSSDGDEGNVIWDREKGQFTKTPSRKPKKSVKKTSKKLEINTIKRVLSEIEETHKEALEWLVETLTDATDDIQDDDDDENNIPIVPIMETQIQAIENDEFKRLMAAIGLHSPDETEQYWRIPSGFSSNDLKKRVSILKGEEVLEDKSSDNEPENRRDNESDSDDAENMFNAWRAKTSTNLVYHESDNEERFDQIKNSTVKTPKVKRKRQTKKNLIEEEIQEEESDPESNNFALSTQEIHSRLNELNATEPIEMTLNVSEKSTQLKRKRIAVMELESSDDDEDHETSAQANHVSEIEDSIEFVKENQITIEMSRREQKSVKRNRSEDSSDDENDLTSNDPAKDDESDDGIRKVHKKAKNKRMVLSDDDDD